MKVLIIGSGGREHAIADAFSRSTKVDRIYVSPGNAGIAREFETVNLPSHPDVYNFCITQHIDLVFIGPEIPIEQGLSDYLRANGIPVFSPSRAAGRIESSKIFAKNLMHSAGIPTARYCVVTSYESACEAATDFGFPLVIKADGLAAGKGVLIVNSKAEALQVFRDLMLDKLLGNAGSELVLEEFLQGWEVSLFAITDGVNFQTMLFTQDHKQLQDHDLGPNTGGMGAYAPVPEAEIYRQDIEERIISPILEALRAEDCLYQGVLYCGLMITRDGPKVIEFNCRFGDPETQAVLPLLNTDFMDVCLAVAEAKVDQLKLCWKTDTAVCVVLASAGYPGKYNPGYIIEISGNPSTKVYFAGVESDGKNLITKGGRVLNVVSMANDLSAARDVVYRDIQNIDFEGKTYRRDIGLRVNKI